MKKTLAVSVLLWALAPIRSNPIMDFTTEFSFESSILAIVVQF